MQGQARCTRPRAFRQRLAWTFVATALTLTLALGGCRATAHNSGAPFSQQAQGGTSSGAPTGSTTSSGGSSDSAAVQQLQSIDSQNQSEQQQLDAAQSGAGVNYTSQQGQAQP